MGKSNTLDHTIFSFNIWTSYDIACWVKISADDILNHFSYFSMKIGFCISCKLSPLHEMSDPIFLEK